MAYTLEVKNTGNTTARDVVVIDNLKNNKAILQKDTIRAYLQDKGFTPKKLSAVSSGFRMETGQDLKKGQSLTVTYQVKLDSTTMGFTYGKIEYYSDGNLIAAGEITP